MNAATGSSPESSAAAAAATIDGVIAPGLSDADVAARVSDGRVNGAPEHTGRSIGAILRANAFTRFNIILGVLFVVTLAFGSIRDTLFIWVVLLNLIVGVVQELRARYTLNRLTVIDAAKVNVRRNGTAVAIDAADVVLDDVVLLHRGEQVPVNGTVIESSGLELDESLLTGEADSVLKPIDVEVLSGSVVVAGAGAIRTTAVGDDSYARRLTAHAREFSLAASELRAGTDRLLRMITWAMVPTAALLLWSQMVANESVASAVTGTVAGISGMVPEGLVLLTSMAFAAGAIRLGQRHVLTRELAAIEGLARVDMMFVDKTGTLTVPGMSVVAIERIDASPTPNALVDLGLAAIAHLPGDTNPTMSAIATDYPNPPDWRPTTVVAFTSQRRWSGACFAEQGTWVLGAPEVVLGPSTDPSVRAIALEHAERGERVVCLCHDPAGGAIEVDTRPSLPVVAVVALMEIVKSDVAPTLAYFDDQGVTVKVLSGDNPTTVAAIAARAGLDSTDNPVDASTLPTDHGALATAAAATNVFGRVGPEQKRAIVAAFQQQGHNVAMTGDGVNDLLAMKTADVGIAMGDGSSATRSAAQFVVLDGGFAALPAVVGEGRRVIGNIERVASLFLTKTVYALALSWATGIGKLPFPLLPRQLSLIGGLSIGIPSFFLAMEPNNARAQHGFVERVLAVSIPAGVISAAASFGAYADARSDGASLSEARTTTTVVLFAVTMTLVALIARPWNAWRLALIGALAALFLAALAVPFSQRFFEFAAPPATTYLTAAILTVAACLALLIGHQRWGRLAAHQRLPKRA